MMAVMTRLALSLALLGGLLPAAAQLPFPRDPRDRARQEEDRLPDGRSRRLALLKADHEKSLEDVREIIKIAEELEHELTEKTAHVLSLEAIEKAGEIEDLSKGLQKRLKRIR